MSATFSKSLFLWKKLETIFWPAITIFLNHLPDLMNPHILHVTFCFYGTTFTFDLFHEIHSLNDFFFFNFHFHFVKSLFPASLKRKAKLPFHFHLVSLSPLFFNLFLIWQKQKSHFLLWFRGSSIYTLERSFVLSL